MQDARAMEPWPSLRHTFSHFHLDITPVLIPLQSADVRVMEADRLHWYALRDPAALGLAAPVKQLLERLGDRLPLFLPS